MQKDLYIRMLEFGDKNPEGFTYDDFIKDGKYNANQTIIVDKYFSHAYHNPYKGAKGDPPLETPFLLLSKPQKISGEFKDQNINIY